MIILQTSVGFLIVLWFFVRSFDLALANYPGRKGWAIAYGLLALFLLLAALIALGFHA